MKAKILHFDTEKTCQLLTKKIKKGHVQLSKKENINIDESDPVLIDSPINLGDMISILGLVLVVVMGIMLPGSGFLMALPFLIIVLMFKLMEKSPSLRKIMPMYLTRHNKSVAYKFTKWKDKEVPYPEVQDKHEVQEMDVTIPADELKRMLVTQPGNEITIPVLPTKKKRRGWGSRKEKVATVYTMNWGEVTAEQESMSPENYTEMGTQGVLTSLLTLKRGKPMDMMMWMIIGGVIGFLAANFVNLSGL